MASSSVNTAEIDKFSKVAAKWWDPKGPFAPLHKLNPTRLHYIKAQICTHFDRDFENLTALKGLKIADIGCGGGLVTEPLSRLGADISGYDADPQAIEIAKEHAKHGGLNIAYKNEISETIQNESLDVLLALEIIEHVDHPAAFVESCIAKVKPGGLVIFSTLNRTIRGFLLGIVAAEYVLNWVPKGTHDHKKFIRPSELGRYIRTHNGQIKDITGLVFDPFTNQFRLSNKDIAVNYFMTAYKKEK